MIQSEKPKRSRSKNSAVIDLYRVLMEGIKLDDLTFPDRLDEQEYKDFCAYCHQVFTSMMKATNQPYLQYIVKNVTHKQQERTALDSRDYNEVQFGRATVNGIALLIDFLGKYAREYETRFMQNVESFDQHRSFEPLTDGGEE